MFSSFFKKKKFRRSFSEPPPAPPHAPTHTTSHINWPCLQLQAYASCTSSAERTSLLSELLIRRGEGVTSTTRRVGPELSKRLHLVMNCSDPEQTLDSTVWAEGLSHGGQRACATDCGNTCSSSSWDVGSSSHLDMRRTLFLKHFYGAWTRNFKIFFLMQPLCVNKTLTFDSLNWCILFNPLGNLSRTQLLAKFKGNKCKVSLASFKNGAMMSWICDSSYVAVY